MHEESQPYPIREFKGLWSRGKADTCPSDHFIDCLNVSFGAKTVETRGGLEETLAAGTVKRTHLYKRINESARMLILKTGGQLFDSVISLSVPILTVPAMSDFSALNLYNRVYISPHDGLKGIANEKVYVYDGTTLRQAGGAAPTGSISATASAESGNIEAGLHLFAVVYETASGFYTKPGPNVFASITASGTQKIILNGIPVGPAGTINRHIIATRAISSYTGNQYGYEYFFVPDGSLNDNITTEITVNFYDAALVASSDYLFNILAEIPAGLVLSFYKTRMMVANFDDNQFLVRVSEKAEPEVMHGTDGLIIVDPEEAGGVTGIIEHRDLCGLTKSLRSYVTSDNGQAPSTWDVVLLDKGVGTEVHGISSILDSTGASSDRFFIASRGGLILFDGSFRLPELTWKVEDIWYRINKAYFHTLQLAYDPINQYIYCAIPLDAAITPSHILFGDCSDGFKADEIKWSPWLFPTLPTSIVVDVENKFPILKVAGTNIHKQTESLSDNNTAINSYVKFGLVPEKSYGINHFNAMALRVTGSGFLEPELRGKDDVLVKVPPSMELALNPGKDMMRKINFVSEKMSIKLSMNSFGEHFHLNELIVFYDQLWFSHPQ